MSFFSLILTAHRRNFLAEALISVAAQTDKDFEFVLCLDIATDKTLECYCTPFFNEIKCSSKKIVCIQGNGTAGFVRNFAFENANSEWISYLDGDDMIAPNAVEIMKQSILNNKDYDIFSSGMIRILKNGMAEPFKESLTYYPPISIYDVDPDVVGQPTFFNQFQAMRKRVWESYRYDTSSNGEDIDFMLIHLLKWHFKKIPHYLYFYRDVSDSFSKITYETGDFTTKRYVSGYYHAYFSENYSEEFSGNFIKI